MHVHVGRKVRQCLYSYNSAVLALPFLRSGHVEYKVRQCLYSLNQLCWSSLGPMKHSCNKRYRARERMWLCCPAVCLWGVLVKRRGAGPLCCKGLKSVGGSNVRQSGATVWGCSVTKWGSRLRLYCEKMGLRCNWRGAVVRRSGAAVWQIWGCRLIVCFHIFVLWRRSTCIRKLPRYSTAGGLDQALAHWSSTGCFLQWVVYSGVASAMVLQVYVL